ncbi:MAG TPA: hypothetical protein VK007_09550 [Acidimicrobiales bacterium]|nr:hypothetical protein [Acidimicrobiales bacterium]
MSRRLRRATAATAALLVSLTSAAGAAESVPSGSKWGGSRVDPPAAITDPADPTVRITGRVRDRNLPFTRPSAAAIFTAPAPGCPGLPELPLGVGGGPLEVQRSLSGTTTLPAGACNGSYRVGVRIESTERMDTVLVVDLPAPTVTGVVATPDEGGRSITVTWDDVRAQAVDLEGYRVERRIGDGDFEPVAALAADVTRYVDRDLPPEGGEATYRVMSHRPSPTGGKVSAASSTEPTPFTPRPADAPDDPGGDDGDGGPGGGPGGDAPDGGGGDAPGTTLPDLSGLGGGSSSRVRPPRTGFSRSFLPPLSAPRISPPGPATSTTIDDGYDEELPYDPVHGPLEAEVPDDELAGFFTERAPGQGMVVPVATALVLAVWAMHLRALARAGRPAG